MPSLGTFFFPFLNWSKDAEYPIHKLPTKAQESMSFRELPLLPVIQHGNITPEINPFQELRPLRRQLNCSSHCRHYNTSMVIFPRAARSAPRQTSSCPSNTSNKQHYMQTRGEDNVQIQSCTPHVHTGKHLCERSMSIYPLSF